MACFLPGAPLPIARRALPRIASCPRRTVTAEFSIGAAIERGLREQFAGRDVSRVLASFSAVREGRSLERDAGTPIHQRAASFVDGLDAIPFHDPRGEDFAWVARLEERWGEISAEVRAVIKNKELLEKGNNVWAKPVVEAANAYGPDWRTLVLQDRVWDPANAALFPVTCGILRDPDIAVPSVEAFLARQAPGSGIALHTDDCNFILTMHCAISAPEGQSWIEVAGERRYWQNGKSLVFDTSYFHQTMNESAEEDRIVLLIRFWHPQLTPVEREALSFLFRAIEDPSGTPAVARASREIQMEDESPNAAGDFSQPSRAKRRRRAPVQGKPSSSPDRARGGGGFGR